MIKLYGGLLSSLPVNVFRTRQAYGVAASAGRLARSTCKSPEGTTWNFPSAKWEKETNFLLERELCYCFSFSKLLFCCKIVSHASYGILIYITKWKLLYASKLFGGFLQKWKIKTFANIFAGLHEDIHIWLLLMCWPLNNYH